MNQLLSNRRDKEIEKIDLRYIDLYVGHQFEIQYILKRRPTLESPDSLFTSALFNIFSRDRKDFIGQ